ncbi:thioredoxin family protein [Salinigranum salinum]|uniref:thioredoxin family protein n=1 Tax=Salinigranum salinum TaxID=1364937 RepID=UPI001260B774|nr:thioredoxin family protein [Salinigranum salinum]
MDENKLFERLVQSGLLTEGDDGTIQLSTEFESRATQYHDQITNGTADITDLVTQVGTPSRHVDRLTSAAAEDSEFVARYLAIRDMVESIEFVESVRVLVLLDKLTDPTSQTAGSPELFLPIRGERLPAMLSIFPLAVVYIWREQCPDCDVMREALETTFEGSHDQMTLLSVYGPTCAGLLEERYDVVGGPTTLFVVDGEIDCRLQGAHVQAVIEREISNSITTAEMQGVL